MAIRSTMIHPIARIIHLIVLAIGTSAIPARSEDAATIPPVEQASLHQLVMADDDIAILRNVYPPQSDSGYHRHEHDLFAVIVETASTSTQGLGQEPRAPNAVPAGSVSYGAINGQPIVHRVINKDDRHTFHAIVVELLRPLPRGAALSARDGAYVPIVDNEKMRAWRLILPPGSSAAEIRQADKGVRIVVRGGMLVTSRAGQPDQTLALRAGDFAVQSAGETRALRNSGGSTIEIVEMELK